MQLDRKELLLCLFKISESWYKSLPLKTISILSKIVILFIIEIVQMKKPKTIITIVPPLNPRSFDKYESSFVEERFSYLAELEHEYILTVEILNKLLPQIDNVMNFVFDDNYILASVDHILPVKLKNMVCMIRGFDVIYVDKLSNIPDIGITDRSSNILNAENVVCKPDQVIEKIEWLHNLFSLKHAVQVLKLRIIATEVLFKNKGIFPTFLCVATYPDGITISRLLEQDSTTFELKFKTLAKDQS